VFWALDWNARWQRHWHLFLRAPGGLSSKEFGALWRKTLGEREGVRGRHYCQPVRNPAGAARYIVGDMRGKERLTQRGLRSRLFGYSRGFLGSSMKDLWAAVREEWFPREDEPVGDGGRGSEAGRGRA
jgi:hypothetical protein